MKIQFLDISFQALLHISEDYSNTEIKGYFTCRNNSLESLKNCPKIVHELFSCSENKLLSMYGASKFTGTSSVNTFYCYSNNLMSMDFLPITLGYIMLIVNFSVFNVQLNDF